MPGIRWARKKEEQRRYWQTVPLPAYAWVVLSGSLIFFSVGLATDPALQFPFWWVAGKAAFLGIVIAVGAAAVRRNAKLRFVVLPLVILLLLVLQRFQPDLPLNKTLLGPEFGDVRSRLGMYLFLSSSAAVMGYAALMAFMGTQGVRLVRARTELELAEKLQQTLAPPLAVSNAGYEIQGRSVPSSQMGGDLLDAVDAQRSDGLLRRRRRGPWDSSGRIYGHGQKQRPDSFTKAGTTRGFCLRI